MKVDEKYVERVAAAIQYSESPVEWSELDVYQRGRYEARARAAMLAMPEGPSPSREERLVKYRCAVPAFIGSEHDMSPADISEIVENYAHAMLAAERPATEAPTVLDSLKGEMIAALQERIELLYSGIKEARDMLENSEVLAVDVGPALGVLRTLLLPDEETPSDAR